jgi:hypothetical protein
MNQQCLPEVPSPADPAVCPRYAVLANVGVATHLASSLIVPI